MALVEIVDAIVGVPLQGEATLHADLGPVPAAESVSVTAEALDLALAIAHAGMEYKH